MLKDILKGSHPKQKILANIDTLIKLIPEIKPMINFEHKNKNHNLDVFKHTLKALELSEDNIIIRTTLLLHDIGKPYVYTEKDNIRHYKGHEIKSKELAKTILKRLNYTEKEIQEICTLIEKHDTLLTKEEIEKDITQAQMLLAVQYCDAYAHHPNTYKKREEYLTQTKKYIKENQRKKENKCRVRTKK